MKSTVAHWKMPKPLGDIEEYMVFLPVVGLCPEIVKHLKLSCRWYVSTEMAISVKFRYHVDSCRNNVQLGDLCTDILILCFGLRLNIINIIDWSVEYLHHHHHQCIFLVSWVLSTRWRATHLQVGSTISGRSGPVSEIRMDTRKSWNHKP